MGSDFSAPLRYLQDTPATSRARSHWVWFIILISYFVFLSSHSCRFLRYIPPPPLPLSDIERLLSYVYRPRILVFSHFLIALARFPIPRLAFSYQETHRTPNRTPQSLSKRSRDSIVICLVPPLSAPLAYQRPSHSLRNFMNLKRCDIGCVMMYLHRLYAQTMIAFQAFHHHASAAR